MTLQHLYRLQHLAGAIFLFFFKWVFVIESFSPSAAKTSLHLIFTENEQENQPNYWITTLPKNPDVNFHWPFCSLFQGCLQDLPYWTLAIIYLGQLHSLYFLLSPSFSMLLTCLSKIMPEPLSFKFLLTICIFSHNFNYPWYYPNP